MTADITRRSVMAAAAALPITTALPAFAHAQKLDPIIALWAERERILRARSGAALRTRRPARPLKQTPRRPARSGGRKRPSPASERGRDRMLHRAVGAQTTVSELLDRGKDLVEPRARADRHPTRAPARRHVRL